ncbi:MAG: sulfatase family protein [Armatimonadota bacterium]
MSNRRPNIVIITTHDSGRHFGCYGVPTVRTPAIDALAADGVLFTQMYAASSICTPSRGALLTGQYPQTNGLMGLSEGIYNWTLRDHRRHLSHVLRAAGYRTYLFGLHHETRFHDQLGFDARNPCAAAGPPQYALRTAGDFANFLREQGRGERPFYAQVGFFETHTPWTAGEVAPDDSRGVWMPPYTEDDDQRNLFKRHSWYFNPFDEADTRRAVAEFQESLRCADQAVGMICAALRESGLEENTLLLFNTDHGPELPGAKWTMYDPGIGIAFILRWPGGGVTGGRQCDWLLNNTDFLPTLAELLDLPVAHAMDGVSFASALRGAGEPPRDTVFSLFVNEELYCARTIRYKLIRRFAESHFPAVQLFDLQHDPLERRDVAANPAYADALAGMNARFYAWLERVDDPILQGPIRTPYYESAIADYNADQDAP